MTPTKMMTIRLFCFARAAPLRASRRRSPAPLDVNPTQSDTARGWQETPHRGGHEFWPPHQRAELRSRFTPQAEWEGRRALTARR